MKYNKTVKLKGLKSHKQVDGQDVETGTISSWEMGKRYTYRLFYSKETSKILLIVFLFSRNVWILQ